MSRSKFCDAVRFAARAILPLCASILFAASAFASTAGFDTPTDPPTRTMPFNIEGVEGMRLWTQNDANGPIYLGIGTTLPLYPLHVIGEAAIGYEPNSSGGLIFTPSATYGNPAMQSVTSLFLASPLLLNPVGGGVGIGTTASAAPLTVNGGVYASNGAISTASPGNTCSPEGMLAYDMNHHQPVYCSNSNVWTSTMDTATYVYAYLTTATPTLCNTMSAKIIYNTVVENDQSIYSTSTGLLTLPAGVWQITTGVSYYNGQNGSAAFELDIYKNGSLYLEGPLSRALGGNDGVGATTTVAVRSSGSDQFAVYETAGNQSGYCAAAGGAWVQAVRIGN